MTAITWAAQKRVNRYAREGIMVECGYTCAYCGGRSTAFDGNRDRVGPDGLPWHVDHVRPADRNDPTTLLRDNLVLACATCNSVKADHPVADLLAEVERLAAHIVLMRANADEWPIRCRA